MFIVLLLVSIVSTILTIISVLRISSKHFIKSAFVLFGSFNSLWLIVNLLMFITDYPFSLIKIAYGLGAATILNALLLIQTFSAQRKLGKSAYIVTELIALAFFLCSVIDNVFFTYRGYITETNPYTYEYTDLFILYFILLGGLLLYASIRLIICYKKFKGIEKAQSLVILIGIVIFGLHPLTLSIVMPIFGHVELASFDVLGSIYFFIAVFFSIFRYRFLDIQYIVKRSTFFIIIAALLTLIYFGSIFISEQLLTQFDTTNSTLIIRFMFILILSFFFLPLRNKVEEFLERTFFRNRFLYTRSLHQFAKDLVTNIDQAVLLDLIINTISKYLKVNKIAIFLYSHEDKLFHVIKYTGYDSGIKRTFLSNKTEVINLMANEQRAVRKIELRQIILDSVKQESHIDLMKLLDAELIVPLLVSASLIGFICLGIREEDEIYSIEDIDILEGLGNQAAIAISNAVTFTRLETTYLQTIESFAHALEAKDYYTQGHSKRVMQMSVLIGKQLGLADEQIEKLKIAALLHDIGKIGINDNILNKPEKLTDKEYEKIKEHPSIGIAILSPLKYFDEIHKIILHHHEKWNGFGYPGMLKQEEIPILSRIITVADAFDAMTSNRSYRDAMPMDSAISEIKRCSNSQFDPDIVKAFLEIVMAKRDMILSILSVGYEHWVKNTVS
ncbi:MAG: HD domain-containing protein [Spirochaetales bacterium]|nr:HD domain-containing protein [Spirochaetales bacterium]